MQYETRSFDVPALEGISEKTISEHLGLYAGYVKHTNLIHEKLHELSQDPEKNGYAIAEVRRRLGFEFCGMRNHEYYFEQFEGGAKNPPSGTLLASLEESHGSLENWIKHFSSVALTRGIGWAILYKDNNGKLLSAWVDSHQEGQLAGLDIVLALDMWEHAYMIDHTPGEKKQYIESFFKNLNWETIAKRCD